MSLLSKDLQLQFGLNNIHHDYRDARKLPFTEQVYGDIYRWYLENLEKFSRERQEDCLHFTKAAILFSIVSRNFLTFAVVFLLHLFFSARYDKTGLCGVTQGEKKKLLKKPLRRGPFPGSDDPSPSDSSSDLSQMEQMGQRGIARRKKTQSHLNVKMEIDHEDKRIAGPGPSTQAHWEKQFADAICVSDDGKNFAGAPLFLEDESNCEDNQTELHRGTGRTSSPAARKQNRSGRQ